MAFFFFRFDEVIICYRRSLKLLVFLPPPAETLAIFLKPKFLFLLCHCNQRPPGKEGNKKTKWPFLFEGTRVTRIDLELGREAFENRIGG